MRVLFDTNVVIDIINRREPFLADSFSAVHCAFENCTACVSTTTITDAVYLTRKAFSDSELQKRMLYEFFSKFKICAVTQKLMQRAFFSPMDDFEDAVQAFCAKRHRAKYIVTRNVKDYALSPVDATEPSAFLRLLEK